MGDAAHRTRKSAHNEGDALDVTNDLVRGPNLDALVAGFCRQMRANPGGRLRLIIFRRRLYSAANNWKGRAYFGVNPHVRHAHIEIEHSRRAIVRPWTLF